MITPTRSYLGAVVYVHYKDMITSSSKVFIEVDVYMLETGIILPNIPISHQKYGSNDGEEWVPHAAELTLDPEEATFEDIIASEADLVIVDFIDGKYPIIRGQFPKAYFGALSGGVSYGATQADGERYRKLVRGSGVTVKAVGAEDGDVVLDIKDGQTLTITSGGDLLVKLSKDTGGGYKVELGTAPGERAAMGEALKSYLDDFIADNPFPTKPYNQHLHQHTCAFTGGLITGNAPTTPADKPTDAVLSDEVKINK